MNDGRVTVIGINTLQELQILFAGEMSPDPTWEEIARWLLEGAFFAALLIIMLLPARS